MCEQLDDAVTSGIEQLLPNSICMDDRAVGTNDEGRSADRLERRVERGKRQPGILPFTLESQAWTHERRECLYQSTTLWRAVLGVERAEPCEEPRPIADEDTLVLELVSADLYEHLVMLLDARDRFMTLAGLQRADVHIGHLLHAFYRWEDHQPISLLSARSQGVVSSEWTDSF